MRRGRGGSCSSWERKNGREEEFALLDRRSSRLDSHIGPDTPVWTVRFTLWRDRLPTVPPTATTSAPPTPSSALPQLKHVCFRRPNRGRGPDPLVRSRTRPPVVRPPCLCLGRAAQPAHQTAFSDSLPFTSSPSRSRKQPLHLRRPALHHWTRRKLGLQEVLLQATHLERRASLPRPSFRHPPLTRPSSALLTQLGKNAPGFLTAVGKAYVENPNPGRQLVEVDHRHLYQTDSHSAPQDFSAGVPTLAPSTLSASQEAEREKKEKEQAKWESNEWLPQGHVKKRANADGAKKGKGKK